MPVGLALPAISIIIIIYLIYSCFCLLPEFEGLDVDLESQICPEMRPGDDDLAGKF